MNRLTDPIEGATGFDLCPICVKLKPKHRYPVCSFCANDPYDMVTMLVVADIIGLFIWFRDLLLS